MNQLIAKLIHQPTTKLKTNLSTATQSIKTDKLVNSITNTTKRLNYLTLSLLISLTSILPILLPATANAAPGDWQWQKTPHNFVGDQLDWTSITSSSDGTKLAAVVTNGYIYTSADSGVTWTEQTSSGQRNWKSITCSSDGNKLAAVEEEGYIYTSTDSGISWVMQGSGNLIWQSIASSSNGTKLAAVANEYGFGDFIYTSTDSGVTWQQQTTAGSRDWQSITSSSDGTKLASVVGNGSIYLGAIEPAAIPDTTTNLSTTRGNNQVSLTWTAPSSDGGSAITDYIVQYKPTADSTWQTFADGTSTNTNATVTSLTNGTQYDFRVRAVNSIGEGNNSSVESATPATIPSAPSITTTPEANEVNLTWSSPDNGGSAITDYIVQYKPTADSTWQTFADGTYDNTSVSVTGLDPSTSYDFQVAAKNIVGDGSFSSTVSVTTLAVVTPDPETPPSSNTSNLTTPSSPISAFSLRPVSISTPTGTNISSSSTVPESSLVTQDPNNQYPLGLVNFSFTTNQSSNQVSLSFITDLTPNQVTPKKYNPSTNTYTNLPTSANAVVSETTIDGKHALTLTYTIIDNGELDLDPTAGTISDPVGLAVSNSTYDQLASTGENTQPILLTAVLLLVSGIVGVWYFRRGWKKR